MALVNSATADVGCGHLLGTTSSFPSAVSPEGGSLAHVEAPPRCSPSRRTGASVSCWFSSAAEDTGPTNLCVDAWRSCQFPPCVPAGCHVSTPQSVCVCRLSRVCPPALMCVSAGSHVCVCRHVSTPPVSVCLPAVRPMIPVGGSGHVISLNLPLSPRGERD